ncbi:MAG: response regulator [Holosporales bacterium]|jgi:two-component system cell cycle sensor histidine kinase/response regulator CckA|nr:response regulator [Holosporales bacterium]
MLFLYLLSAAGILGGCVYSFIVGSSPLILSFSLVFLANITLIAIFWRKQALKDICHKNDALKKPNEERLFANIFDNIPLGIIFVNGETIAAYNKTCKKIVGDDLAVGKSVLSITTEEKQNDLKAALDKADCSLMANFSLELPLSDEKSCFIIVYFHTLPKKQNTSYSAVLYILDITRRWQVERKLLQSQKMQMVGKLAGGIAHDFNNLLTAMTGYCDLLLARYLPNDQSFNDIMQIKQNANRAANLIKQLLAFSRQQILQPKIVDVMEQLSELSALLRRLIGPDISLKLDCITDFHGAIKIDQTQFEQIIINLTVNARDAMPEGGSLTITVSSIVLDDQINSEINNIPVGKYVLLEIKDTGLGVPREHIAHMFEPFFSTKEKGLGTGLGLSTVYGIVRQIGGFISVESKVGSGSAFNLYFPFCQAKPKFGQEFSQAYINAHKRTVDLTGLGKILLIEDEDAVRMFAARALRDKGYYVVEAVDGAEGIEFLKNDSSICLVVSDVVMPFMGGVEFLKQIREMKLDIDILFISGYAEEEFRLKLQDEQKVYFLQKPFGIQELASKVKSVLLPKRRQHN